MFPRVSEKASCNFEIKEGSQFKDTGFEKRKLFRMWITSLSLTLNE